MSTAQPLIITNGLLVLPEGPPVMGSVHCENGKIVGLGDIRRQTGVALADAKGALIAPGLVDCGVFAIDKPAFHFGGITRAALMPDQSPVLDHPARVRFAAQSGKPDLWVHPMAAATRGLEGAELAELALMRDAGAKAVATGRQWIADSGIMLRLLRYSAMLGLVVVAHAEDGGLVGNGVATAGEIATRLGLAAAPAEAEALAVARDIALAEMAGARLHFRQVTTASALALVRAAKARGVAVTAGITPAHFMLSDLAIADFRTFARMSPPLRCEADRQAVLAALADGTIDVIASGHDPRGPEDKRLPFSESEPGMAGAETLLALSLNLVRDGTISTGRLFELLATNPARILGLNAGRLEEGCEADIIMLDPDTPWQIDGDRMAALAGNTPFDRLPVQGRVRQMMKGGKVL